MANQTYQLVINGTLANQFVANVFHFQMDDASYPNRLAAAAGLIAGFVLNSCVDNFLLCCPVGYTVLSVKARCVTGGGGPEFIDLGNAGDAGNRTGNVQTSSAGPVVLWLTDGPNRSQGKTFIPGISVSDAEGGEISAAAKTAMLAAVYDFMVPFSAQGSGTPTASLCIAKASNAAIVYLVTNAMIAKDIGKLRRRQLPV